MLSSVGVKLGVSVTACVVAEGMGVCVAEGKGEGEGVFDGEGVSVAEGVLLGGMTYVMVGVNVRVAVAV